MPSGSFFSWQYIIKIVKINYLILKEMTWVVDLLYKQKFLFTYYKIQQGIIYYSYAL